ncbi:MAG: hypothetical protein KJ926_02050, partial [Candidatus Omnitrophica bacterium]|nr:hypothetical protein [Candidatus Omnitrophota bacterium]
MVTNPKENYRYCAFTGSLCNKLLPNENDLKVFFAYPSVPKINGYMNDICNHVELKGMDLFPWINLSDSGGIIFCKICS